MGEVVRQITNYKPHLPSIYADCGSLGSCKFKGKASLHASASTGDERAHIAIALSRRETDDLGERSRRSQREKQAISTKESGDLDVTQRASYALFTFKQRTGEADRRLEGGNEKRAENTKRLIKCNNESQSGGH